MSVRCIYLSGMHLRNQELPPETLSLKLSKHWRTYLVTLLIFVETLAAIVLVCGATMHLYSYFPQHNSPMHSQNLNAQAVLLL